MAQLRTAAAKPKTEPKRLHAIRIEIGKDGGHVVHHEHRGGNPMDFGGGEEHPYIFGAEDGEKLSAHLNKHLGLKGDLKGEEHEEKLEHEDDGPSKGNKKHKERENASTETDDDEGGEEEKKEEDE
jgi:hypothetical protein